MQQNLERSGVGSHDNELANTAVERLGGLVGTLLQLAVVRGLLDKVKNLLGEGSIGEGKS